VLDEYCDPVDLKKHLVASDDSDLRGAYIPNHSLDDDYSVPYEVKKILSGKQLVLLLHMTCVYIKDATFEFFR